MLKTYLLQINKIRGVKNQIKETRIPREMKFHVNNFG
jgi:hypothetical protein